MLVQAIPLFQDAHLLRRSMLEALSDYTFLVQGYLYKGYSDGILSGCELTTTKDTIVLNEGIVLFAGQLLLIKEPMTVSYYPTNTTTVMKLCLSGEMRDANFIYREAEVKLTQQKEIQAGEMELCRFKLQEGARLRYHYQSFEDRDTEFDTLNRIHVPYAAVGGSTLAPDIVKSFARELLEMDEVTELDSMLAVQILSQERSISREALKAYILCKNGAEPGDASNLGIYKALSGILQSGSQKSNGATVQEKREWRLMVE